MCSSATSIGWSRLDERGDRAPRVIERLCATIESSSTIVPGLCRVARWAWTHDVGELLGEPVVQVARDSAPFFENGGLGELGPVSSDLPRCADQYQRVYAEPKRVADLDPADDLRWIETLVQTRERGQNGRGGKPEHEVVALAALRETDRGDDEESPGKQMCD